MKRALALILTMGAWLVPTTAQAATKLEGSAWTGAMLAAVMSLLIAACLFMALRIFSFLKGGEMASAWQIMAVSFVILVIAEVISLIGSLKVANVSPNTVALIRLIGVATVMVGVSRIKRVLS
jgi:FtsH-binding integral membrane protein